MSGEAPDANAVADQLLAAAGVPCGNHPDCDRCYPEPWFKVSTERVSRVRHERRIKAATEAEALAIYEEGVAWPDSYDERDVEMIEAFPTKVEPFVRGYRGHCFHDLPSAQGATAEICEHGVAIYNCCVPCKRGDCPGEKCLDPQHQLRERAKVYREAVQVLLDWGRFPEDDVVYADLCCARDELDRVIGNRTEGDA